jgi:hypothetical protein
VNTKDHTSILEARIRILVDKIAEQSSSFDRMQNKMFAIVGLLLTLGGLMTYDIFKIDFPDSVLEYIIFIAALLLLGVTATLIAYDYRAKKAWSVPIGPVEEEKLDMARSYLDALVIIHKDYREVYSNRDTTLDRKVGFLNASLYMFVISIILLAVLKIGG